MENFVLWQFSFGLIPQVQTESENNLIKKNTHIFFKSKKYPTDLILKMIRGLSVGIKPNGNRRRFLSFLCPN